MFNVNRCFRADLGRFPGKSNLAAGDSKGIALGSGIDGSISLKKRAENLMKLVRFRREDGSVAYAAERDGGWLEVEGDLYREWRVSDRPANVAKVLAPVVPSSLLCIGLNYRKHAEETGAKLREFPVLFMKGLNAVQNPEDPIEIPRHLESREVDFECELVVVIGKTCKNVTRGRALDYVLGYTCGNDVSARDWQKKWGGGQWCRGKTFDTFCPLGPVLVTTDEITNPNELRIRTILNGETMQDWNTNDMLFDVPALIEFLSGSTTLLPGTVIMTGTPHGVGMARNPPVWMKAGDTVSVEIEQIGVLTNPVIDEQR
jgi:2-keto-4-pentenoate hydratase/2-oxohepta-3-ene-1,7-dioic acid hydratase in catechol pathway